MNAVINFLKKAAPFGQSLIIAICVAIAGSAIAVLGANEAHEYEIRYSTIDAVSFNQEVFADWAMKNAQEAGCSKTSITAHLSEQVTLQCTLHSGEPLWELRSGLQDGVELIDVGVRTAPLGEFEPRWWAVLGALLAPVLVSIILLRGLDFRGDLHRSFQFFKRYPWLPFIAPGITYLALFLFGYIFPAIEMEPGRYAEILYIPSTILYVLIIAPLFEEALFRQWVYERTIYKLPVWLVAAGGSWAFSLSHIFSPQASMTLAYLPAMFVFGLFLYWVRYVSNSLIAALVCHLCNNALPLTFVVVAGWVMSF